MNEYIVKNQWIKLSLGPLDRKVKYNYSKLAVTREYKVLVNLIEEKDYKEYANRDRLI